MLACASAWTAFWRQPASSMAAHEAGHGLALWRWGGRLRPAQWTGGVVLALLLLPVHVSSGPYLAEHVDAPEDHLAAVHVAGPLANLGLAAAAFLAYLFRPIPLLLLTSQINVTVCAYTLLPNVPLDGHPVHERHPFAAAALGLVVAAAGMAFALGAA